MKKNIIYLIIVLILGIVVFIPDVKRLFFPIDEIKKQVTVEDSSFDIQLKGINTTSINLKNLKGNKVLFLNFWGTWCAPCREEWPSIEQLYHSKKEEMDFALIAMMDKEDDVRKFIKENNYTAPVYIAESPINEQLLPKVFPTTYILGKDGAILKKETSTMDWNSQSILRFIDAVTQ